MKLREIICKRWLLAKNVQAITIYPFIFYHGIPTPEVRRHELVHVNQVLKLGWFKFYSKYLWEWIRKGYKNISFEKEAYRNDL